MYLMVRSSLTSQATLMVPAEWPKYSSFKPLVAAFKSVPLKEGTEAPSPIVVAFKID